MFEPDRRRPRSSEQAPQLRVVAAEPSVPPHWTGLADAENEAAFCSAWLSSQCTRISGVIAGLLMMPPPAKGLSVASTSWPKRNPYLEDLSRLAERASSERRAIVSPGRMGSDTSPAQPVGLLVALPLGVWKPAHRCCCCCSGIGQLRRAGSRKCCRTAAMGCGLARSAALGPALQGRFQPMWLEPHRLSTSLPQSGSSPDCRGWRSPSLTILLPDFAATVCRWASSGETAAFACARFPIPPPSRVKAAWLMRSRTRWRRRSINARRSPIRRCPRPNAP